MRARALLIAAVLATLLVAGCSTRTQRLYRRAEAFFAQGKYQLAATEYERIITQDPHNPLAADAIYKLAYIQREVMVDLPRAVWWYERLANDFPDSAYASDALLWVVEIQARRLQDLKATRATTLLILQRYPGNASICGRAQLLLAQLLDKQGKSPEALAVCRTVISQAGAERSVAGSAMLLTARITERSTKDRPAAAALYQTIIQRYSDTPAALEAKRALGLSYYDLMTEEQKAQRAQALLRARVIAGVAPFASDASSPVGQLLGALSSMLAQAGAPAAESTTWGLSGAAFQFIFSPTTPSATGSMFGDNPLTTVAEELGFTYGVWAQEVGATALVTIEQSLHSGRPVLILYGGGHPRWALVVGYKPADKQVYLLLPGAGAPTTVPEDRFLENWRAAPSGSSWSPASRPGFQFALVSGGGSPEAAGVARRALARAVNLAQRKSVAGAPCGRAAGNALVEEVRRAGDPTGGAARKFLAVWAAIPLQSVVSARRQAAAYLAGLSPTLGSDAGAVGERYGRLAEQWAQFGRELRAAGAADPSINPGDWAGLLLLAQQLSAEESAALDDLARLAGR